MSKETGYHFERTVIEQWLKTNNFCPLSGNKLQSSDLIPNQSLSFQIQSWIQKSASTQEASKDDSSSSSSSAVPPRFHCPLTQKVMDDPIKTPQGISYERSAIMKWLKEQDTCPVTDKPLSASQLTPNTQLQCEIDEWQLGGGCGFSSSSNSKLMEQNRFRSSSLRNHSSSLLDTLPLTKNHGKDADRFKKRFAKDDLLAALDEAITCSTRGV